MDLFTRLVTGNKHVESSFIVYAKLRKSIHKTSYARYRLKYIMTYVK